MKNSADSVFKGIPVGEQEPSLVDGFLTNNDFSPNTRRAFATDLGKFARWFVQAEQGAVQNQSGHDRRCVQLPGSFAPGRGAGRGDRQQGAGHGQELLLMAGRGGPSDEQPGLEGEGTAPPTTCTEGTGPGAGSSAAP